MKVCEVCGALQSALDVGKRITMHLEGKSHQGYLKIRNKLAELRQNRNHAGDRGNSPRSRDYRSLRQRQQREEKPDDNDMCDYRMIFSSRKLGSGANMPSGVSQTSFSEMAIQMNQGYAGHSEQLGVTNLGKEWRWYKKELDSQRRKAKKQAERAAMQGSRPSYHQDRGSYTDRQDRGGTYLSRDRESNSYQGGGSRYGGGGRHDDRRHDDRGYHRR